MPLVLTMGPLWDTFIMHIKKEFMAFIAHEASSAHSRSDSLNCSGHHQRRATMEDSVYVIKYLISRECTSTEKGRSRICQHMEYHVPGFPPCFNQQLRKIFALCRGSHRSATASSKGLGTASVLDLVGWWQADALPSGFKWWGWQRGHYRAIVSQHSFHC